jgi:hypothetical protein
LKNFIYSILREFILVIRQSDGPAIKRAERKVPTSDVGIARSQPAGQACYPTTAPARVQVL